MRGLEAGKAGEEENWEAWEEIWEGGRRERARQHTIVFECNSLFVAILGPIGPSACVSDFIVTDSMPTVKPKPNVVLSPEEIASALRDRPHLTAQVVTIRDDKALNPQRKLERITALIRGDAAPPVAVPKQISELEAAQAAWRPSSAQLDGARKAAAEFGQWAIAAEEIRPSKPLGRVWSNFGGEALERQSMLQHVDLIDARYLISLHQHGGVVPRWQHVPPAARINTSNVWRLWGYGACSLGILVLSYPYGLCHPDQQGEQLGRIVPILKHARVLRWRGIP